MSDCTSSTPARRYYLSASCSTAQPEVASQALCCCQTPGSPTSRNGKGDRDHVGAAARRIARGGSPDPPTPRPRAKSGRGPLRQNPADSAPHSAADHQRFLAILRRWCSLQSRQTQPATYAVLVPCSRVISPGCGQCGLQRSRPFPVGLGEPQTWLEVSRRKSAGLRKAQAAPVAAPRT